MIKKWKFNITTSEIILCLIHDHTSLIRTTVSWYGKVTLDSIVIISFISS